MKTLLIASTLFCLGASANAEQLITKSIFEFSHQPAQIQTQIQCIQPGEFHTICGQHGGEPYPCVLPIPGDSAINYSPVAGVSWLKDLIHLTYDSRLSLDEHGHHRPGFRPWNTDFFPCDDLKPIAEPLLSNLRDPHIQFSENAILALQPVPSAQEPSQYKACRLTIEASARIRFDDQSGRFDYYENLNAGTCTNSALVEKDCQEIRSLVKNDLGAIRQMNLNWQLDKCHNRGKTPGLVSDRFFQEASHLPYKETQERMTVAPLK